MFRGREIAHKELGIALLDRVVSEASDLAIVELESKVEGRSMILVLAPK